jgi:hypothetical protein
MLAAHWTSQRDAFSETGFGDGGGFDVAAILTLLLVFVIGSEDDFDDELSCFGGGGVAVFVVLPELGDSSTNSLDGGLLMCFPFVVKCGGFSPLEPPAWHSSSFILPVAPSS